MCARNASLTAVKENNMIWFNSLTQEDAWSGIRRKGALHPASMYIFGPLIDAPPSHPDTIRTTLTYTQKSLVDMGMEQVHLCMDM